MNRNLPGAFAAAIEDYRWLLDRGYPEQSVRKLVGDRYDLSREERRILLRGVCSTAADRSRRGRRVGPEMVRGELLLVDFYNVVFTLLNYHLGRPVFVSSDGFLRDAGALHGRLGREERLLPTLSPLLDTLSSLAPRHAICYLDAPVSHSADHATLLRAEAEKRRLSLGAEVVDSADYPLKRADEGVLATGDSAVIDASRLPVFDLSAYTLESRFSCRPPQLPSQLPRGSHSGE